jgi:integrase
MWWASAAGGGRRVDSWIRATYDIASGTVQSVNSLRGAVAVQGILLAMRLRTQTPNVPITEAHPKALFLAFRLARYRDQRLRSIKPCSLKRQLNPIRHLFEIARHKWGIPIRDNPIAMLGLKAPDQKRERRLRPGEFERLMQAARVYRNPLIERIIRFAIATGMRRGEILAMKWQHIDLADRSLLIPFTKTGHSRTIPLAGEAVAILTMESKRGDVVFPIKGEAFRLAWDRITTRAKIDDLRFHDLRHEAISRFFEIGLTTPEAASISGHRDARMLFRYAHAERQSVLRKLDQHSQSLAL